MRDPTTQGYFFLFSVSVLFLCYPLMAILTLTGDKEALYDQWPNDRMPKYPALETPQQTSYKFEGIINDYLQAVTNNWLMLAPINNPAMLDMFAMRNHKPYHDLLPWSGEFAGKYLTTAAQMHQLLKEYYKKKKYTIKPDQ